MTDSVTTMEIFRKAAHIFKVIGDEKAYETAKGLYESMRESIRNKLIDFSTMSVHGNCQTSQAMSIFYGVLDDNDMPDAFKVLLNQIEATDRHMAVGVLGARVLFHVLSENGEADLAYEMITRPDYPSYGNLIKCGATTLWENFYYVKGRINSLNHHFWGDISAWFYRYLAGINVNPQNQDANNINIEPAFIVKLDFVKASYTAKDGTVTVNWKRQDDNVIINTELTGKVYGKIILPNGFVFDDNSREKELKTAEYTAFKLP